MSPSVTPLLLGNSSFTETMPVSSARDQATNCCPANSLSAAFSLASGANFVEIRVLLAARSLGRARVATTGLVPGGLVLRRLPVRCAAGHGKRIRNSRGHSAGRPPSVSQQVFSVPGKAIHAPQLN
jgi:hypothetical protein